MRGNLRHMVIGLVTALSATAVAQDFDPEPIERLDAGVSDVGPLSLSLRDMQVDLRHPTGFDRVYRAPGRDDLFMRVYGGLYAVFPRSLYAPTSMGDLALIPDGTTFYIGAPSMDVLATPEPTIPLATGSLHVVPQDLPDHREQSTGAPTEERVRQTMWRADPNYGGRAEARRLREPAEEETVRPAIVSDEAYRARRMEELMRRAADAATGAGEVG